MGYGDSSMLHLILGGAAVYRCDPRAEFRWLYAVEVRVPDLELRYNFASPAGDAASRVSTLGDDVSNSIR